MDEQRETITGLHDSKAIDIDEFNDRVREEAETLREHLQSGTFNNEQATIGLEYEFYGVEPATAQLRRVPHSVSRSVGFERELGLHNVEFTSGVQPCTGPGLTALEHELRAKFGAAQTVADRADGLRLVSDGVWTIGPAENTTEGYLTDATHDEGLALAINVSNSVRYHGFGSVDEHTPVAARIDLPGVTIDSDTAGPVSLTTSIQPHLQPRRVSDLPAYHNSALRIAGPVLALAVNSPFLPPSLYDDDALTEELLLEQTHAENRIPVYEQMMNPGDGAPKVTFPRDLETPEQAVDRIVADETIVPALIEGGQRFDDEFVHFRHKHGSYWRWVRPVFDGPTQTAASARIEFRPLPGQPTLPDTVSLVALVVGLVTGLVETNHPATTQSWETAKTNFYAAARDGLDAELAWITADDTETSSAAVLYEDLFALASDGLQQRGLGQAEADRWLAPLRDRVAARTTPASWKRDLVASELSSGATPAEAVQTAQQTYIDTQTESLFDGSFAEWVEGLPNTV